jgi:hypothetical protein
LDSDDLSLIENELHSKLRPIDFIFRSPGVNRPLMPDDSRQGNTQNLFYRDQINKVANAIKQIIQAIKYPGRATEAYFPISEIADEPVTPKEIKSTSSKWFAGKINSGSSFCKSVVRSDARIFCRWHYGKYSDPAGCAVTTPCHFPNFHDAL